MLLNPGKLKFRAGIPESPACRMPGRIRVFVRLLPTMSPLRGLFLFSFVFYRYATPTGFSCWHSADVQLRIRDAVAVTLWTSDCAKIFKGLLRTAFKTTKNIL